MPRQIAAFSNSTVKRLRSLRDRKARRAEGLFLAEGLRILTEARDSGLLPEIVAFYQQEVIIPGLALIRRIFQRGMDSGEFRQLDMEYAIYNVIAPMIFLIMTKHSMGACVPEGTEMDPVRYINAQADAIIHGLVKRPGASQ